MQRQPPGRLPAATRQRADGAMHRRMQRVPCSRLQPTRCRGCQLYADSTLAAQCDALHTDQLRCLPACLAWLPPPACWRHRTLLAVSRILGTLSWSAPSSRASSMMSIRASAKDCNQRAMSTGIQSSEEAAAGGSRRRPAAAAHLGVMWDYDVPLAGLDADATAGTEGYRRSAHAQA